MKKIERAQSQVLPRQWQMHAATEQAKVLEAPKIDETKALAQADKLMTVDRDLKRTHLGMLIRIRNLLSDAQRAKLTFAKLDRLTRSVSDLGSLLKDYFADQAGWFCWSEREQLGSSSVLVCCVRRRTYTTTLRIPPSRVW